MIENIKNINKSELLEYIKKVKDEQFRFITITCVETNNRFEIIYHFAKDYYMQHFRTNIEKDEELDSISDIYFCAMLVENEIKDLFGIKINNIVVDYDGKLLLSEGAPFAPMCSNTQIQIEVKEE